MTTMDQQTDSAVALADEAHLYHQIAEGVPNMVWTAGPDGALDYFNARVFEYTGMTADALRGWGWSAVIHPDDWEHCERTWRGSLLAGEPYRIEFRIRRGRDGAYRWHLGAALPLRGVDGRIARWFGTCTDVEDQKRDVELLRQRQDSIESLAAERLRAARETDDRYRALVEKSGDAIIVRQDGRFVYVNLAAVRLYGFGTKEDLLGKRMADFAHPDDYPRIRRRAAQLAAGMEVPPEEFKLLRADGRYAAVEVLAGPFAFHGRPAEQVIMRDLSERRKADLALRKREHELNEAQRLAQIGSWEWEVETDCTTWSREMYRIFGRDPDEAPPPTELHHTLFTPESWAPLQTAGLQAISTGEGYALELEAVLPDGRRRWVLARGEGVRDEYGRIVRLRGTVQDITERRLAEATLRWSEGRFQSFMDNTPAIAWMKDSQFRFSYVSKPYEAQVGQTLEQVQGRTDFEVWPEPLAQAFRRNDEAVLRAGVPLTLYESALDPAGCETHWLVAKFPLPDSTGRPGVGGMAIDVTEKHRLEQEMRDHQAQATLALEAARMGYWSWSADDRRITHSEGMGLLFGLERGAQVGTVKDWIPLVHPEDRDGYLVALRSAYWSGRPFYRAWRALKPDGSTAWLLTSARSVPDAQGRPARMVGVIMDITERRSAQFELQQAAERVQQLLHRLVDAQEAARRKLANALHDLIGQNLTALGIGLDILKSELPAGTALGPRIGSMASTVGSTIDAIRNVMAELHPAVLDDYGLVPALHAQAERFRGLTGIGVEVEATGVLPRLANGVELALYRIVQESLANVARHSGAKWAAVRVDWRRPWVALAVEDDGRGLVDPTAARSTGRGGWGLPAMRERAEAVGGRFTIEPVPGGGTRVRVELRVPDAD